MTPSPGLLLLPIPIASSTALGSGKRAGIGAKKSLNRGLKHRRQARKTETIAVLGLLVNSDEMHEWMDSQGEINRMEVIGSYSLASTQDEAMHVKQGRSSAWVGEEQEQLAMERQGMRHEA